MAVRTLFINRDINSFLPWCRYTQSIVRTCYFVILWQANDSSSNRRRTQMVNTVWNLKQYFSHYNGSLKWAWLLNESKLTAMICLTCGWPPSAVIRLSIHLLQINTQDDSSYPYSDKSTDVTKVPQYRNSSYGNLRSVKILRLSVQALCLFRIVVATVCGFRPKNSSLLVSSRIQFFWKGLCVVRSLLIFINKNQLNMLVKCLVKLESLKVLYDPSPRISR